MKTRAALIGLAASLAVAAAACSSSDSDDTVTSGETATTSLPAVDPGTSPATADGGTTAASPPESSLPPSVLETTPATPKPAPPPTGSDQTVFEPGTIDPGLQPFIDMAVADLAERLEIDPSQVTVVTAVLVVWSDAGLGCPEPGMSFPQVPEDGSVIELSVADTVYRYHSGGQRTPFLCEQPLQQPPLTGDSGSIDS